MVTLDDVRRVALALPETTEKPSYGELAELLTDAWRLLAAFEADEAEKAGGP